MGTIVIDLGKKVEINLESGCWCSSLSQSQINLQGNLKAIERSLQSALDAVRKELNGSR